jgi:YggT family protein
MFARSWTPRGPALVMLELVYSVTDPPIRAIRRIMPPIRLGGMALDLSPMIVLIICYVLQYLNRATLLA